jgi:hypothetical protein
MWAAAAPAGAASPPSSGPFLKGEWRVVAIDGRSTRATPNVEVRADASKIWWEPSCAGYVLRYRIKGVHFSTASAFTGSRGGPPALMCLIAPPVEIAAVFKALGAATRIARRGSGELEISGGGHSLQLASQEPASAAIARP